MVSEYNGILVYSTVLDDWCIQTPLKHKEKDISEDRFLEKTSGHTNIQGTLKRMVIPQFPS